MKETILTKIIEDKFNWIKSRKLKQPLITFKDQVNRNTRNFYNSLKEKTPCFILEYKKASPTLGVIRNNFDLAEISNVYKKYASSVSVLTDSKYFHGNLKFIKIVRQYVTQPVLCKDFFIDSYQVYLARYYHADAILLMLSILDDFKYQELSTIAKTLNMGILTEVNNEVELKRALQLNANVIGINNRNLHDLSIDLNRTRILSPLIKKDTIIISESGITKYREIKELNQFVNGFLIGSHLMSKSNLEMGVRSIVYGDNKICGLTRSIDVQSAQKYGAIYGGLIFSKNSLRYITKNTAKKIIVDTKLRFVGIFQNEEINLVAKISEELSLYAVQLHGCENQKYVDKLRKILPQKIKIWKAFSIQSKLPDCNWNHINLYLFDSYKGGSKKSFNWSILQDHMLDHVILAGGINVENCIVASKLNSSGLDFNSGVEVSPGIKDPEKIRSVFKRLRYN